MIEMIPAIDMIEGQCVRLSIGDYARKTVYSDDPVDVARHLYDQGFRRLHLVDLDGARAGHCVNLPVLERICAATELVVDYGGGVRSEGDVRAVWDAGAAMVTVGSLAATQADMVTEWVVAYGKERFIIGADVMDGRIRTHGWMREGGAEVFSFIDFWTQRGVTRILCTDISRDGMLSHPNIPLYERIMRRFPRCELIASGGVSCTRDILDLHAAGIPSVVFGKAYYEGKLDVKQLLEHAR